jgi:drug/metabolite transporter (DMT)-like permease
MLALWVVVLAVEAGAQIGLKLGSASLEDMSFGLNWLLVALASPWVIFGIICYLLAFASWMVILDRMALSLAYPLSGLVYVVVMLISAFGLHEQVKPWHWIGVGLIIAGVYVLARDDS